MRQCPAASIRALLATSALTLAPYASSGAEAQIAEAGAYTVYRYAFDAPRTFGATFTYT